MKFPPCAHESISKTQSNSKCNIRRGISPSSEFLGRARPETRESRDARGRSTEEQNNPGVIRERCCACPCGGGRAQNASKSPGHTHALRAGHTQAAYTLRYTIFCGRLPHAHLYYSEPLLTRYTDGLPRLLVGHIHERPLLDALRVQAPI